MTGADLMTTLIGRSASPGAINRGRQNRPLNHGLRQLTLAHRNNPIKVGRRTRTHDSQSLGRIILPNHLRKPEWLTSTFKSRAARSSTARGYLAIAVTFGSKTVKSPKSAAGLRASPRKGSTRA